MKTFEDGYKEAIDDAVVVFTLLKSSKYPWEATEELRRLLDSKEGENDRSAFPECTVCHVKSEDVCSRPDWYAQEIGNAPNAYHIACYNCNHENSLDI